MVMETLESGDHVVASNQVNPLVTFVTYSKILVNFFTVFENVIENSNSSFLAFEFSRQILHHLLIFVLTNIFSPLAF